MKTMDAISLDSTARVRFANILFPTDLAPDAERALPYALEIARRYHATVHVVHVLRPDVYAMLPPEAWPKMAEIEEETRREFRRRLGEQFAEVSHEIIFETGAIWPVLSRTIVQKKIDLIVLGTHAPLAIEKIFLGSVAEEIYRRAVCPVLTVGPSAPLKPRQFGELGCILFATDFSAESLAAGRYAISLAREHRAHLVLMYCRKDSEDVHTLRHALGEIVPFGAELREPADCVVERGRPAEKIIEVAEAHEADMIVLGIRKTEHAARAAHLPHSGSYEVVARAKCPVLTVRG